MFSVTVLVFTTLGNDGFLNNMAFLGKSFSNIGILFKTSFGNAFADVNSKFDTAVSLSERLKANMSGMGQGLKGVFTTTKESPLELMLKDEAESKITKFAEATQSGAVGLQKFNNELKDKGMKAYLAQVDAGKASFEGYTNYINATNAALQKTTLASKAATLGMKGLAMAGNMLIGFGIGLAINALITVISKLATAQQDAIDKANELTSTYKSNSDKIKDNISSLQKMDDELARLSKGVDENGKNISLTAEEYARYRDIISEVVDMNPSLIKGYNDEGQELVNNNTLIQDAIDLQRELNRLKMEEYLNAGEDILKGSKSEKNQAKQEINSIVSGSITKPSLGDQLTGGHEWLGMSDTNKAKAVLEEFGISFNDIMLGNIDALEILSQKRREIISLLEQEGILDKTKAQELNTQIGLIDIQLNKLDAAEQKTAKYLSFWAANDEGNKPWYNDIDTEYLDDFSSSLNVIASNGSMSIAEMQVKVMELGETFAGMQDKIPSQAFEDLQMQLTNGAINEEQYEASLRLLLDQLDKLKETYPELAGVINSVGAAWRGMSESANQSPVSFDLSNLTDNFNYFNTELEKLYGSYDILNSALDEFTQSGAITAGTFRSLSDNNLLQYLNFTSEGLQINTEQLLANEQTLKQKAQADLSAALYADLLALATTGVIDAELDAQTQSGNTGSAAEIMGQKFANSVTGVITAASALDTFHQIAKGESGTSYDFSGKEKQVQNLVDIYNNASSAIQNVTYSTNSASNAFGGLNNSAKNAAQEISKAKSSIESLTTMVVALIRKQYETQRSSLQSQLTSLQKSYDAQVKALNEEAEAQKKIYDQQRKAIEDKKDALKSELDTRLKILRAKEDEYSYEKELKEKNKNISELKAGISAISNDDSLEGIAKRKELQTQLDEALSDLEDTQRENSVKKQEEALQEEYERFVEQQDNKTELINQEQTKYDETHQRRLEQEEARYNASRMYLEQQIADIDLKLSQEGLLRQEAMNRISTGGQELYNQLLEYNRIYGDGVDATVKTTWENAYNAIRQFGGGQESVLATLNNLVSKMNEYDRSISKAADSSERLKKALAGTSSSTGTQSTSNKQQLQSMLSRAQKDLQLSTPGSSEYNQISKTISELKKSIQNAEKHHTGINSGVVGGSSYQTSGSEILTKLIKGEIVITPEQAERAAQNIYNSSNYSVEHMSDMIGAMLHKTNADFYQSIRFMASPLPPINIDQSGDIVINGGANESIIPVIKKVIKDSNKSITDMVSNTLLGNLKIRNIKMN